MRIKGPRQSVPIALMLVLLNTFCSLLPNNYVTENRPYRWICSRKRIGSTVWAWLVAAAGPGMLGTQGLLHARGLHTKKGFPREGSCSHSQIYGVAAWSREGWSDEGTWGTWYRYTRMQCARMRGLSRHKFFSRDCHALEHDPIFRVTRFL